MRRARLRLALVGFALASSDCASPKPPPPVAEKPPSAAPTPAPARVFEWSAVEASCAGATAFLAMRRNFASVPDALEACRRLEAARSDPCSCEASDLVCNMSCVSRASGAQAGCISACKNEASEGCDRLAADVEVSDPDCAGALRRRANDLGDGSTANTNAP